MLCLVALAHILHAHILQLALCGGGGGGDGDSGMYVFGCGRRCGNDGCMYICRFGGRQYAGTLPLGGLSCTDASEASGCNVCTQFCMFKCTRYVKVVVHGFALNCH